MNAPDTSPNRGPGKVPLLILLVTTILVVGVFLWQPVQPPRLSQHVTLYPSPKPLPEFRLMDRRGGVASKESFRGHWSLVFFGYTHCPDVCPTTLGEMQQVLKSWHSDSDLRIVFVSVDPKRDTPERLNRYLGYFGEGFDGLTGGASQIDRLARAAGAFYRIHEEGESAGGYLVDHTAGLTLVDPKARIVALFPPPIEPRRLTTDLREIIRYREEID